MMIIADKPVGRGLVQLMNHISIKLILQLIQLSRITVDTLSLSNNKKTESV